MTFSFCIRFNRSPTDTIQTEASEIVLRHDSAPSPLKLHAPDPEGSILNAKQLVFTGHGYTSLEAALTAGETYQRALVIALARHRIGADFGVRSAKGIFTNHGLSWLEEQVGQRILNNVHGLMAFESEPTPRFALTEAKPLRGVNQAIFEAAFASAVSGNHQLSERETVAFSLFNASFFQQTVDSQFLLLMMAIETLLDPQARSVVACLHVQKLIEQTKISALPDLDKISMMGSLRWLANESISQAGKRLAHSRLGDRLYNDLPAPRFFTNCYDLRSRLVHGSIPYPIFEEVSGAVGALELFVSDLITSPFLGIPV